jgi:hypothetical protein
MEKTKFNDVQCRSRPNAKAVGFRSYVCLFGGKGAFTQTERKFRGSWLFRGRWLQEVKGQDAIQQP